MSEINKYGLASDYYNLSQIEKEGADNLSLKEAYLLVMKEKPSCHRGLVHNLLEKAEESLLR